MFFSILHKLIKKKTNLNKVEYCFFSFFTFWSQSYFAQGFLDSLKTRLDCLNQKQFFFQPHVINQIVTKTNINKHEYCFLNKINKKIKRKFLKANTETQNFNYLFYYYYIFWGQEGLIYCSFCFIYNYKLVFLLWFHNIWFWCPGYTHYWYSRPAHTLVILKAKTT